MRQRGWATSRVTLCMNLAHNPSTWVLLLWSFCATSSRYPSLRSCCSRFFPWLCLRFPHQNLERRPVEFCRCARRIEIKTKVEDAEDPLFTETRPDALDILISSRLPADCDLARRGPDFDRSPLKGPGVSSDPKLIAHRRPTTIQWPYQLALRLAPILQLVPRSRTTSLKDRVGAMGHSLLHPSHLFIGVCDRHLHLFTLRCAFLIFFCCHG
jgi:hypothetical protein